MTVRPALYAVLPSGQVLRMRRSRVQWLAFCAEKQDEVAQAQADLDAARSSRDATFRAALRAKVTPSITVRDVADAAGIGKSAVGKVAKRDV